MRTSGGFAATVKSPSLSSMAVLTPSLAMMRSRAVSLPGRSSRSIVADSPARSVAIGTQLSPPSML